MTTHAVPAGVLAVAFLAAGALAVPHRRQPGTVAYVGLMAANAAMAVALVVTDLDVVTVETAARGFLFCWYLATALWAVFALEYTGRGPVMTRRRTAVVVGIAPLTGGVSIGLGITGVDNATVSLLVIPLQVTVISLSAFGVVLVARSGVTYDDLPLGRSVSLSVAGTSLTGMFTVAVLSNVIDVDQGLLLATGILGITAVAFLVTQLRLGLFDSDPSTGHLARETLLDQMSESVLLVDRRGQLLDVNDTAVETFGIKRPIEHGQTLESVVGEVPNDATDGPITLETRAGKREFEWRHSDLTRRGDTVGRIHALRDVTERRTDEQRLSVLNRVLRHNLRNDLDAIRAYAETLTDDAEVDPGTAGERIEETARGVAAIGDTVASAEQLLKRDGVDRQTVDLVELAQRVVSAQLEEHPDARGDVSGAADQIRTDPRVLETILEELVENALKHADVDPSVEVVVSESDDGVTIRVRDNGPGIPEHERAVLLQGEETPLNHGSGLGLWLVYWGVKRLGGNLSFGTGSPRGSVVTVSVPSLEAA